jgi:hypothetical protein
MHYCIRCGGPCDCWAFDSSHGDVCDGCSDCADDFEDDRKGAAHLHEDTEGE